MSTGLLLLGCLVIAIVPLWYYAPSALVALRGGIPMLNESLSNIYGMTALGLVMLVISLVIFIKMLLSPVSKRVNQYLEKHPGVTGRTARGNAPKETPITSSAWSLQGE